MVINLSRKKVLITAGPTWVPVDKVRVIGNLATGETGIQLAEKFAAAGARVTLLLGPVQACCLDKRIRLLRYTFFDELAKVFTGELRSRKYDIATSALNWRRATGEAHLDPNSRGGTVLRYAHTARISSSVISFVSRNGIAGLIGVPSGRTPSRNALKNFSSV